MDEGDRMYLESFRKLREAERDLDRALRGLRTNLNRWLRKGEQPYDLQSLQVYHLPQVRKAAQSVQEARKVYDALDASRRFYKGWTGQEEASGGG